MRVTDERLVYLAGAILFAMLTGVIWWNRFLPMQDYPQHLFMSMVATFYDDPAMAWSANFEVRESMGPYRGVFLLQNTLAKLVGVETAGKVVATLYIVLIGLLAHRVFQRNSESGTAWGALLLFPLCLHPMYFYGFLNFTLALPLLLLAVMEMENLVKLSFRWQSAGVYLLLVFCLFMLHPYVMLVQVVLAVASVCILARGREQILRGSLYAALGLILLLAWAAYDASTVSTGGEFSLGALNMKWWPLQWNTSFLALCFTGLQFTANPNWYVAGAWLFIAVLLLAGSVVGRRNFRLQPWFLLLFLLALSGFFLMPFSVHTDARYTFVNARMAPVLCLLLAVFLATLPLERLFGGVLAVTCIVLTAYSVALHDRVSREIESFIPIFDKMQSGAAILPLVRTSPSAHLDPFFYANFHYNFPFYYHVLKGGGTNPDMFNSKLMPIGYRPGHQPARPPQREPERWTEQRAGYDYVLTQGVSRLVHRQLGYHGVLLDSVGPWRVYKLK